MATVTEARTLPNYIGGEWVEADAGSTSRIATRPPVSGGARPLSGVDDVDRSRSLGPGGPASWRGRRPRSGRGAGLRESCSPTARRSPRGSPPTWARPWPTPMRSAAGSSRSNLRRRSPTCSRARPSKGCVRGRRRDGPATSRRRRRDHPVQLPGDDPALVPALRRRLRQRVPAEAIGARSPTGAADLRADRRAPDLSPGIVNLVHGGHPTRSRRSSSTPASMRSRSSARRPPPA